MRLSPAFRLFSPKIRLAHHSTIVREEMHMYKDLGYLAESHPTINNFSEKETFRGVFLARASPKEHHLGFG